MDKRFDNYNLEKNKKLIIGIVIFSFQYSLYGTIFELVKSMCDLGIIIQSNLKFTLQCNNVRKKAHYLFKNTFNTSKHHDYAFYKTCTSAMQDQF